MWRALFRKPSQTPQSYVHVDVWEHGWEYHPCTLPTDVGLVHMGNIWNCPKPGCGRRFRAVSRDRNYVVGEGYENTIVWEEVQPILPVTDEDIQALFDSMGDDTDGSAGQAQG